jgi:broad specificity phosphatase PhoE
MIIGLVRHFKVDLPFLPKRYNADEFNKQMLDYDSAPVIIREVEMDGHEWDVCYCSNLPRAVTTAENIYNKELIKTELLREVPLRAFTNRKINLPTFFWHVGGRIAWRRNGKSQPETFLETKKRINEMFDIISACGYSKILLVTHGFFMRLFTAELKKKGFNGEIDVSPRNGKLYVFNNNNSF